MTYCFFCFFSLTKVGTPARSTHVITTGLVSTWEPATAVSVPRGLVGNSATQVRKRPSLKTFRSEGALEITFKCCDPLLSSGVEELLKCLYQNGHCQHFCDGSGQRHKCFCANGYKLGPDRHQCVPEGTKNTKRSVAHHSFQGILCLTFMQRGRRS